MHTQLLCGLGALVVGIAVLTPSCTDRFAGCDKTLTCAQTNVGGEGGVGGDSSVSSGGDGSFAPLPCEDSCAGDAPYCHEELCVECLDDEHCEAGFCAPTTHTCAACVDDEHCPASAPVCEGGACVGCSEPANCEGVAERPFCHEPSGACVECLPGEHESCGAGRLCHGQLHECVDGVEGGAVVCEPCVADAHCPAGHRCVLPGRFEGEGFVCLPERDAGCGDKRPLVHEFGERTSMDGEPVTICGHRFTSCRGLRNFSTAVAGCSAAHDVPPAGDGDSACGLREVKDNTRCRPFAPGARCTLRCQSPDDCPCGFDCTSSVCSLSYDEAHDCE